MRSTRILVFMMLLITGMNFSQTQITSPDGNIKLSFNETSNSFSIYMDDNPIISHAEIDLIVNNISLTKQIITGLKTDSENQSIEVAVSYKNKEIQDEFNQLTVEFESQNKIEFRVYNEGVAYRFITSFNNEIQINETANYTFPENLRTWSSLIDGFTSSYEVPYRIHNISEFPADTNSYLPILFENQNKDKILLTEADVYNYPHMFLKKGESPNQLAAVFPPFPIETELYGDRRSKITKGAEYISKSKGGRTFPWRIFIISDEDKKLIESDIVYKLSRDGDEKDLSWIKPGRVSWDWWNALNLYGVDFKTGLNTATWKYYLDFAAANGLEYIILDEGWSISTSDITKPNENLDLPYLIKYGKDKNVDIILWTTWRALNDNWLILDRYAEWGIAGIKIDFMDRADQWMVEFYEKAAKETFSRKLIVDFHGSFKPAGLRRQYPNVVSYEGVCGLENSKWSKKNTTQLNTTIPFIRMVCGPMDYTPGAMRNYHGSEFTSNFSRPGSQGTRAHQVALFILYESGIQMLADSPSNYFSEKETTEYLSHIPVQWDETIVLEAKVGEFLTIARRNGDEWYIAGITGGDSRIAKINLSFLNEGEHKATIFKDGINSDMFAEDYIITTRDVTKNIQLDITINSEGGFAIIIK